MTPRNIVILGALLTIVGCFCPFIHIPVAGSITYMANGNGDGTWVIGLSVVALICASVRLPGAGAVVGGIIVFLLFRAQSIMNEALARMHAAADGAGFLSGFAQAIASAVYVEFGFYVVAAGAALMLLGGIASFFIRRKRVACEPVSDVADATPEPT